MLVIAHCVTGRQLYLHWVHKIPIVLVLAMCIVSVILLAKLWKSEWTLVAITLQVRISYEFSEYKNTGMLFSRMFPKICFIVNLQ